MLSPKYPRRLAVALAPLLAVLTTLAAPSVARAWVYVGTCHLHAYVPSASYNGAWHGEGRIDDCSGLPGQLELTVCAEVRTPSGGAAVKSGTCVGPVSQTLQPSIDVNSNEFWPAYWHSYRTYTEGQVFQFGHWSYNEYVSGWEEYIPDNARGGGVMVPMGATPILLSAGSG